MRHLSVVAFLAAMICGCTHFVEVKDRPFTDELQKKNYVLLKDVKVEKFSLSKGQLIHIVIVDERDWVKAYGIPADRDRLQADRVLLLYLFKDDFPMKAFDRDFFSQKLGEIAVESAAGRDDRGKKKKTR